MASEFAPPPPQLPQHDDMKTETNFDQSSVSYDESAVNGDTAFSSDIVQQDETNGDDLTSSAQISAPQDPIVTKDIISAIPDPNPAGPTPVDDVAPGIEPIADFLPKDAPLSHPTPPPDEPLVSGAADVDVEMANVESDEPTTQQQLDLEPVTASHVEAGVQSELTEQPQQTLAQPEPSLVRPREDDVEDEPAAKRSKLDEDSTLDVEMMEETAALDAPTADQAPEPAVVLEETPAVEPAAQPLSEVAAEAVADPISEVEAEAVPGSTTEPTVEEQTEIMKAETTQLESAPPVAPTLSIEATDPVALPATTSGDEKPAAVAANAEAQPQPAVEATQDAPKYSTVPMTPPQRSALLEKMKNLKKTKNSTLFLKPVDIVALNIPTYPDIIKEPMDLSTMDSKLKDGSYVSVQDFANDFDLIINNTVRFNGPAHAVTQAGRAMEAYFKRMMETVPSADMAAPPKPVEKKRSPSIPREKRRESRAVVQPTISTAVPPAPSAPSATSAASATTPSEVYALQPDGTPQIRRQSSNARPARAIKPPQAREIPYAKPKRKEHQLELKFCEHVLDEIRSPKFGTLNHVFLQPVDPVALNIPHYRQVIKNPMDLSTMSQKLKSGQYGTAGEFKKDFDLIVNNCLVFNPIGNPVRDLGIQFKREFDQLWANKDKWERNNQPASNRASSASADEESEPEDEVDEDDDDAGGELRALQKQLAALQNKISDYGNSAKSKKAKSKKTSSKKQAGSLSSAPAKKPAPKPVPKQKKARQVTYEEKQEISNAVENMDEKQVGKLTEIITTNVPKYAEMDEMELEIDELPNHVQLLLLDYVHRIFGNPKKKARDPSPDDAAALDDDDYEEKGGSRGGKRKKHKPMGKKEQQDSINAIKDKLARFQQPGTSGSESPTNSSFNVANAQAETSGDEESEESEEE